MAFKIEPVEDSDFPRIFELISVAFGHEHPYIEYVYPFHDSPPGRRAGAQRMLFIKNVDPNTMFIKVTNEETKIIGVSKWNFYKNCVPKKPDIGGAEWYFGNEELRDFAQVMFDGYTAPRMKAIKEAEGNLVSLDVMVVDPEFQRRNVGRMMVKWGTKIADQLGFKTVVEATAYGVGLYQQEGFNVLEWNFETKFPDRFKDWPTQKYHWLERPSRIRDQ